MLLVLLKNMVFNGCVIVHYRLYHKLISFSLIIIAFISIISDDLIYIYINM